MNRKHDNLMNSKEEEIETLDQDLNVLNDFKDTKHKRQQNLLKEEQRYERLKRQLDMLKKNGKLDME